jgi:hypothetical protein
LQPGDGVPLQRAAHLARETLARARQAVGFDPAFAARGRAFFLPGTLHQARGEAEDEVKQQGNGQKALQ